LADGEVIDLPLFTPLVAFSNNDLASFDDVQAIAKGALFKDESALIESFDSEAADKRVTPLGCQLGEQWHRNDHVLLDSALTSAHDLRQGAEKSIVE
jgi:hypothetical protein